MWISTHYAWTYGALHLWLVSAVTEINLRCLHFCQLLLVSNDRTSKPYHSYVWFAQTCRYLKPVIHGNNLRRIGKYQGMHSVSVAQQLFNRFRGQCQTCHIYWHHSPHILTKVINGNNLRRTGKYQTTRNGIDIHIYRSGAGDSLAIFHCSVLLVNCL